jgi:hypothetical protein
MTRWLSLLALLLLAVTRSGVAQSTPTAFRSPALAPAMEVPGVRSPAAGVLYPRSAPPLGLRPVLGWTAEQFVIFGQDGWDVLTFWDELDRREALLFGGVVAVGGLLLSLDEPLQEGVERNTEWGPLNWLQEAGEFLDPLGNMGDTNKFYVAGWLIGGATGWDALERVSRQILFSHYIAALTRQTVRDLVGRQRPFEGEGPYSFEDGTSFPSGHASSIIQVASVLSDQIDWWPASVALYTMTGLVSYERISSGSHWPSDVWIGALWGWGVAHVVLRNAERREATEAGGSGGAPGLPLRLSPVLHGLTGQPGLQLTIPVGGPRVR